MSITSITRIQHRRGLKTDLPTALAEGEIGLCLDTREMFIGNSEGFGFNTQILTEWSDNTTIIKNKFAPVNTTLSSSIVRSIGNILNDFASIKDFGAVGDGITDDTQAINNAIAELFYAETDLDPIDLPKHIVLYFPPGVYLVSQSILLYPYVSIIGAGIDKTIIRAITSTTQTHIIETVDSIGETGANIGLSGYYPKNILVSNLTLDTNSNNINIANMTRYQFCKFKTVKFKGSYQLGEGLLNNLYAVSLNSIGNTGVTNTMDFIDCVFTNITYCCYSDDPVKFTSFTRCTFTECWAGVTLGLNANYSGPFFTTLNQCRFYNIDENAISVISTNPGAVSMSCQFLSCNMLTGVSPIYWAPGTVDNDSIGDVFA